MYTKYFKITLVVFIIIISTSSIQTFSIYKRNENDYPRTITYPYQDLLRDLQRLRELNDPVINKYLDEIERAIRIGDYSRLLELLRTLEQYLIDKGYSSDENSYINILTKLLKAIEKAGPLGLEINYEKLDRYLIELFEKAGFKDLVISINIEKILSLIQKYGSTIPGDLFSQPNNKGGGESSSEIQLSKPSSVSLPNVFTSFPLLGLEIPMYILILIPIAVIAVFLLLFIGKRRLFSSFITSIEQVVPNTIKRIIHSFREINLDPVIILYNKWYTLTRIKGYRRNSYETLREYLNRISESSLSNTGLIVTSMYEDRVYGDKVVSKELLSNAEELLSKVESREK